MKGLTSVPLRKVNKIRQKPQALSLEESFALLPDFAIEAILLSAAFGIGYEVLRGFTGGPSRSLNGPAVLEKAPAC